MSLVGAINPRYEECGHEKIPLEDGQSLPYTGDGASLLDRFGVIECNCMPK